MPPTRTSKTTFIDKRRQRQQQQIDAFFANLPYLPLTEESYLDLGRPGESFKDWCERRLGIVITPYSPVFLPRPAGEGGATQARGTTEGSVPHGFDPRWGSDGSQYSYSGHGDFTPAASFTSEASTPDLSYSSSTSSGSAEVYSDFSFQNTPQFPSFGGPTPAHPIPSFSDHNFASNGPTPSYYPTPSSSSSEMILSARGDGIMLPTVPSVPAAPDFQIFAPTPTPMMDFSSVLTFTTTLSVSSYSGDTWEDGTRLARR